jgi:hypothetical protein
VDNESANYDRIKLFDTRFHFICDCVNWVAWEGGGGQEAQVCQDCSIAWGHTHQATWSSPALGVEDQDCRWRDQTRASQLGEGLLDNCSPLTSSLPFAKSMEQVELLGLLLACCIWQQCHEQRG